MRKTLIAVATVAALGMGGISGAQAQEPAVPFIAGAVIGTVLGVVVAKRYPEVFESPVAEEPAPQVVYIERPVVIKRGPPRHVHHPRYDHRWGWRADDRRPDWR